MEKRYQVFLSSTYADLKNERQRVIQTLMEMDCIPSGMELFPAMDEEQWEFIKKIIDDCDYYLLVIGGRYGSTTIEGISYTEKEYDYAIENGIKVIAFLHSQPDEIPAGKTDKDPELYERLNSFRDKVSTNRLVKYWKSPEELPGLVALSLSKTIKTYPAVGWVRANELGSQELLGEINSLRKENDELKSNLVKLSKHSASEISDIADMEQCVEISGEYKPDYSSAFREWRHSVSWNQIFALIAPYLLGHPSDKTVKDQLKSSILECATITPYNSNINDQVFQTVKVQMIAYGLVDVNYSRTVKGGMGLFWNLTEKGRTKMIKLRVVRSNT